MISISSKPYKTAPGVYLYKIERTALFLNSPLMALWIT
jgi:LysM repeat protein